VGYVTRCLRSSFLVQVVILSSACLLLAPRLVRAAENDGMAGMHEGMSMPMDSHVDAVTREELLADKRESEFNHHLAGLLVLIAGLLILADGSIRPHWAVARHVWPICFLVSGIFLLIFSDTELWPFASQSWYYGLTHHMEVLQHKVFAVLLLALGVIELRRARGTLTARWSGWVFPLVAAAGSVMLLFHDHQGGMMGPNHMELMHRIQSEHYSFAVTGLGIALSKGLAETRFDWRPFFERLFPALLVVLGALLLVYVE
jgi:copper resistance protein D